METLIPPCIFLALVGVLIGMVSPKYDWGCTDTYVVGRINDIIIYSFSYFQFSLGLEKQATKAINEINKAHSIKHKCESMDKLFEEMRHNIMEGIYNIRFESNSFLYIDRESTVLQEYLKYMQRYDIELRSALN